MDDGYLLLQQRGHPKLRKLILNLPKTTIYIYKLIRQTPQKLPDHFMHLVSKKEIKVALFFNRRTYNLSIASLSAFTAMYTSENVLYKGAGANLITLGLLASPITP